MEFRLVEPLLHALGYEGSDIDPKYPVVFQQGRVGRRPEADYVVFYGPVRDRNTSLLVVEAKKPGEALVDGKAQGESYAANLRTPFLLLTNGETLELWQLQVTKESECILNIPVASLAAERGRIEQLISKAAAYDYCRSLQLKTITEAFGDYGRYESAELKRTSPNVRSINRTLRPAGSTRVEDRIGSETLLKTFRPGAVIVAPSGCGKTTLSGRIFRQAIEERWQAKQGPLAFDVPLPDLEQSAVSIPDFMQRRIAAHCPAVSGAALEIILRETGATILCDGFDRLSGDFQRKVNTDLANLVRDFPLVQLFVFSREVVKPKLGLPVLLLEELSDDQMRELERILLDDGSGTFFSVIGLMPDMLRSLCTNPLLLELSLGYWKQEKTFPVKIEFLFRSWLDSLLKTEPGDSVGAITRERALSALAQATSDAPITGAAALSVLAANGIPATALNELVACDAVRMNGYILALQHEGLADYLRAKAVASQDEAQLAERLPNMQFLADSFYPVLLMAQLPSHRLQTALWKRLSQGSPDVYLNALRYRFDVSSEMERLDTTRLSQDYLRDLVEGIEMPLEGFFPELRDAVLEHLLDGGEGVIAVTGMVNAEPAHLAYGFHPRGPDEPQVTVGRPPQTGTICFVNLDLSHYRLDSGRLLGMTLLRDSLLELVKQQVLKGGPIWAHERLIGRVRYLSTETGLGVNITDSLDALEDVLGPHAGKMVRAGAFSGGETFSIDSLLHDIATLRANGKTELDPWWIRLGWNEAADRQDDETLRRALDEHYRRTQQVYAEIVLNTFPALAAEFGFYPSLPVRWNLTVVRRVGGAGGSSVIFKWLPVTSWDQAGADVTFADSGRAFGHGSEARDALARLNRLTSNTSVWEGFRELPFYDGREWTGHYDGATPVTHDVCQQLVAELKRVFEALPAHDSAK